MFPTWKAMSGTTVAVASSGGVVVAPCGSLQDDELVTLHSAGMGLIPNAGTTNTTITSLWRDTTTWGSGVPQPSHRLKWRQSQALPGEAQSLPFRKFWNNLSGSNIHVFTQ